MLKFDAQELAHLTNIADTIFESDSFDPKFKRFIPRVDKNRNVYDAFHERGTRAAILVGLMRAVEQGLDPVQMMTGLSFTPDESVIIATSADPDPFTRDQLAAAGDPKKPDFNSLMRPAPDHIEERAHHMALNADIAAQEDEILPPGEMAYQAPQGEPEPTPTPTPAPAPTPKPKKPKNPPKATAPSPDEALDLELK